MAQILKDIRVLDLTRVLAGPWCTQTLGELGAEILKIENPDGGDDTRRLPPHVPALDGSDSDLSAFFISCNRGKQSIALDISTREGQDAIRELVKTCDVFIENFKVGNLARYGLDHASLSAINPRLVYCSITGYGQTGPMAAHPGYDILFQGISGAMSTCGHPDGLPGGGPMRTLVANTDIMTGMYACTAILAALMHVKATGEGQHIDLALLDVAVAANAYIGSAFLLTGRSQPRVGNSGVSAAPSGVYRCQDGDIIIQSSDRHWTRLCDALDKPTWKADARFDTLAKRLHNAAALDALIAAEAITWRKADLVACVSGAGVPCAPVNTIGESFDHPQVRHRELVQRVAVDGVADIPVVRNPIRFSKTPVRTLAPPHLGEHDDPAAKERP